MNRFVIASKHPAFGKLYLGRTGPVVSKKSALTFGSKQSAEERIAWWQRNVLRDNLDPKFFGNMFVEEIR